MFFKKFDINLLKKVEKSNIEYKVMPELMIYNFSQPFLQYLKEVLKFLSIVNRALVRGGARGAVAPPRFWDLLNRISKKIPIS